MVIPCVRDSSRSSFQPDRSDRTGWKLVPHRRGGFTLVELLVVIVIILILASLVVALNPRIAGAQKVAKGGDLLQGWLAIARQRAKRDQIPTGVRLIPDPNVRQGNVF